MSDQATTIALIGNPNCGKTTLFNALTGAHQRVGNWPGVTVERKSGHYRHGDERIDIVDLPGIYTLLSVNATDAEDARIARDYLASANVDAIVNVVDASSLARGLYLTSQLLDLDTPVIVALNMMDVADRHGMHIDPYQLSQRLGCPVVPVIASRREGVGILKDVIAGTLERTQAPPRTLKLSNVLETSLSTVARELRDLGASSHTRFAAAALAEGDRDLAERITGLDLTEFDSQTTETLSVARYHAIDTLLDGVLRTTPVRRTVTDVLDAVFLNRILAFPLFLGVIYLMFLFTINVGSAFIDLFDLAGLALFVEGPRQIYDALGAPAWLSTLLADGVGGGVQLVGTFIPVIACLFLFLSFLEDSGYMVRAAFIIDRAMRKLGLPGKSFVPLIVGFGCNVPAVMAARTLDNQQDRILTTLMAPYMSCGARLTVYALFAVAFFPSQGQNLVFALYLLGIVVAIVSALIVRRFLLVQKISTFVMELPAYHLPTLRGLLLHTWHRLKGFVTRAGKAIVAVVIVLNVVSSLGTDYSFGNQNRENSMLSAIGKAITPAFSPMGIEQTNWPATVGIFTGIFAKEVVVGTLDALYSQMGEQGTNDASEFSVGDTLAAAFATVPANLATLADQLADPLGIDLGDLGDTAGQAAEQNVTLGTIAQMQRLFESPRAAFAYLVFILLYMPCVATIGAIYKELSGFWAAFSTIWSVVMAYTIAVICYQMGELATDTGAASVTILGMIALQVLAFSALIHWGRRHLRRPTLIPLVRVASHVCNPTLTATLSINNANDCYSYLLLSHGDHLSHVSAVSSTDSCLPRGDDGYGACSGPHARGNVGVGAGAAEGNRAAEIATRRDRGSERIGCRERRCYGAAAGCHHRLCRDAAGR
ncbi:MAG: Fe(2+) transporter permease subunit FeoB [Gammaproteobacteria bacterium]|nr:Fe(2+) transporter permease subunit FeoB [Gammaproteobacteria bacterium]